jgi:glycosyltransferase involved in cell wall biosynthesis
MNLLLFTAGAARMYCGSCLRDNALASELARRGHAVTLLPLYTPTRTDEANVSTPRVFFGGVSVYLEQVLPLFRRTPRWMDWIWDRPAFIRAVSARSIQTDPRVLGELTVSMLRGEHGHQRKEFEKLVAWLRSEPPPAVVNLPNSLLIGMAGPLRRALTRPVCCTLQGEDLFLDGLHEPYRSEALALIRQQVADVDLFIAISEYYAAFMSDYLSIPAAKIRVVPLGVTIDEPAASRERPRGPATPFTVGYFARIAPEKGLDRLCAAYRRLRRDGRLPAARLEAAGYLGPEHRAYLDGILRQMGAADLGGEFVYHGALDREEKLAFLRRLDVFSVPTPYHEPKGLFLLEAMACGVPVVQPRCGAFPEMIARTAGGVLVEPDSEEALADGLFSLYRDREQARRLGQQGAAGVRAHYSVGAMAERVLEIYGEMTAAATQSPPGLAARRD